MSVASHPTSDCPRCGSPWEVAPEGTRWCSACEHGVRPRVRVHRCGRPLTLTAADKWHCEVCRSRSIKRSAKRRREMREETGIDGWLPDPRMIRLSKPVPPGSPWRLCRVHGWLTQREGCPLCARDTVAV